MEPHSLHTLISLSLTPFKSLPRCHLLREASLNTLNCTVHSPSLLNVILSTHHLLHTMSFNYLLPVSTPPPRNVKFWKAGTFLFCSPLSPWGLEECLPHSGHSESTCGLNTETLERAFRSRSILFQKHILAATPRCTFPA